MARKPAAAEVSATNIPQGSAPRIVKKVPRETDGELTAKQRKLGGVYRIIHGSMMVPLPEAEWKNPDGTVKKGAPTLEVAVIGDEIYLGDEDAMRAIAADLVEPLNALPSRLPKLDKATGELIGGVFKRPITIPNSNGMRN